jgi:hypothetical protein
VSPASGVDERVYRSAVPGLEAEALLLVTVHVSASDARNGLSAPGRLTHWRRLRHQKMAPVRRAMRASPPIIGPTIIPMGIFLEAGGKPWAPSVGEDDKDGSTLPAADVVRVPPAANVDRGVLPLADVADGGGGGSTAATTAFVT